MIYLDEKHQETVRCELSDSFKKVIEQSCQELVPR